MNSLLQEKLSYDKTFDCVQCGYCLPACPTYETMERETHSPRGRINLVKMVAEGKASVEDLKEPIEKCLGCMACTTVCPTNVQYGEILESAKHVIDEQEEKSRPRKLVENFMFQRFFPSSAWMDSLGHATWLYQTSGLKKVSQRFGLTKRAPLHLHEFEAVLPEMPSPKRRKSRAADTSVNVRPQLKLLFSRAVSWIVCFMKRTKTRWSCCYEAARKLFFQSSRRAAALFMHTPVK